MKLPKVFAHGSYIGTGGYNNHTRDFFRELSKHLPLKVRNFTVGKGWEGLKDEPHNSESYLTIKDKELLNTQTTHNSQGGFNNDKIYSSYGEEFEHNVNLCLVETNHYYYYDPYIGPKIGYNVWESTLQPEGFFNKWKEFDQLWVPSKWQAECTIKQGADPDKVKIVPEGVDTQIFYPEDPSTTLDYVDGRFKFVLFGRWDYRKSTKEIIETFLSTFTPEEPVDLILSIDNSAGESLDGFKTTEERLKHYGLTDPRLKVKHFPSREDYITYLKNGHVFLSCARSEGWNLPLIEAMACGTPSIYSACSGQMEFAEGKGLPVKVLGESPTNNNSYANFASKNNSFPGNYYDPDFEDLSRVMRDAFENYTDHKKRALEESKIIHKNFSWENVGKIGAQTLREFMEHYKEPIDTNRQRVTYFRGKPRVEINGEVRKQYHVEFIDSITDEVVHSTTINNNMWVECNREYYTPWIIKINGKIIHKFDLEGKRVLISLESKSIGDTIAWAPYAVEFAKKHNCKVILSTFHNKWFQRLKAYKEIEWANPGQSVPCYAHYRIGWFKTDKGNWEGKYKAPTQPNLIPLQQTATDILGLKYTELNHGIDFVPEKRPIKDKYVCIAPRATAGCKEWPHQYWTQLAKILTEKGYKVVNVSYEGFESDYIINKPRLNWKKTYTYLHHAEFLIGLSSGISWFNWAAKNHTVMVSAFTEQDHEFITNVTRISSNACFPCWNNPNFTFDAGDWDWCPIWKGTSKQHICHKSITPEIVINKINHLLK